MINCFGKPRQNYELCTMNYELLQLSDCKVSIFMQNNCKKKKKKR